MVRFGETNLTLDSNFAFESSIRSFTPHRDFVNPEYYHDIALIRMRNPVKDFTRYVLPLCLPDPGNAGSLWGQTGTIAGWGASQLKGKKSPILRSVSLTIESQGTEISASSWGDLPRLVCPVYSAEIEEELYNIQLRQLTMVMPISTRHS